MSEVYSSCMVFISERSDTLLVTVMFLLAEQYSVRYDTLAVVVLYYFGQLIYYDVLLLSVPSLDD